MTATAPRIDVQFFESDHTYTLNGSDAFGVTTILKGEGLSGSNFWKQEHRDRGTAVHKIAMLINSRPWRGATVEEIIQNSRWDPDKTDPALIGYGYAEAKFLLESGFRPELVERPVGSQRFGICGTLDAWGSLPSGEKLLPDFKSGLPQESAWLQLQLYAMCLEETYGVKTDVLTPVWLQADGGYKIWPMRRPGGADLAVAQCAVNLYKWRAAHKMLDKEVAN